MIGKNRGKTTWNKGKTFNSGKQTKDQTYKIMKTRLKNLVYKIKQTFSEITDDTIKESKNRGIIAKNSPISILALIHFEIDYS